MFAGHRLCAELLAECELDFDGEAVCRRLRPRVGRRHPGDPLDLKWMDTTDGFKGFKKLHYFPNVALAVSKTGKLEVGKVYGAPAGWHWGSKAEVTAIMGGGKQVRRPEKDHYYDQGGWVGSTWDGVERLCFVFSDSLQAGGYLHPSWGEGEIREFWTAADLVGYLSTKWFAGIICVAD